MSIWSLLLDNDYRTRADLAELKGLTAQTRRRIHDATLDSTARALALEEAVGELALLCRSLLTLLKETGHVDPNRLAGVMQRVDLEDGVPDGRVTPARHRPGGRPTGRFPRPPSR